MNVNGNITPIFGDEDNSRGASAGISCVGGKRRVLIISGEFTGNVVQGAVYLYDNKKVDAFFFSEKHKPIRLYIGSNELWAVMPTYGYGEYNGNYVVNRYDYKNNKSNINVVNNLPQKKHGMEIIALKRLVIIGGIFVARG